ncbi:MAG: 7-carboxy-7-deazaguanine synthase [Paenibacillaceae bacterium]|jgi:7-carboxy-7-deazaguanine synthase|nr:7-carboxy-7-deazaguanine synthase [Paenibacillaceae bacterium]
MNKGGIPVLEIFGPTVQGEGMAIGRKTMFVRTAGCDYRCIWCDSAFTWDGTGKEEIRMLLPEEIWEQLYSLGGDRFDHVTLSGGNPLLLRQLGNLVFLLREKGIRTAVETQASVWQDWVLDVDEVTLSPKPPSSGMATDAEALDNWIRRLSAAQDQAAAATRSPGMPAGEARACQALTGGQEEAAAVSVPSFSLKIVCFDETDLDFAADIHSRYPHVPMFIQTGNRHTSGGSASQVAERLLEAYGQLIGQVMDRSDLADVRVLPQLHTLVWGNKRGV